MKVLVDSSFLFLPINCKIDIVREVEHVIRTRAEFIFIDPVYSEIENIIKTDKQKLKKNAKFALEILKTYKRVSINRKENESVDDCIVRTADDMKYIVATADMELRKKLRDKKIQVIYPRGGSHLVVEGFSQDV